MEYTQPDMSQFVIDTININNKPIKFAELDAETTLKLLSKGYEVEIKEDKKSITSIFYSIVFPKDRNIFRNIKNKLRRD